MIPLERIRKVKNRKPFFDKHGLTPVFIYSRQWGAYWRPNCSGYTNDITEAGVYSFSEAFSNSGHCGPEKGICYQKVLPQLEKLNERVRESLSKCA